MKNNPQTKAALSSDITIRKAGLEDAAVLAELGVTTFSETFSHLYKEEDLSSFLENSHSLKAYRKALEDPQRRFWIAETTAGAPVGYMSAGPCSLPVPDLPAHSGELGRIYILKEYQGAGLGRRMLDIALRFLREEFANIYLSVYSENYGAQRLYQRFGFVKIGEYSFMVGAHADREFIMKLDP